MSLAALLAALRFSGVIAGIAFLTWALAHIPVAAILSTALPAWPATFVRVANYFGVILALQCFISFVILRVTIAAIFAVARMF